MALTIDNNRLRDLIPGVIHEVEGESLLVDKIAPWLDSAAVWLEDNFVGAGFSLPPDLIPLAEKIVVNRAFAQAVPSLDLVLSPAGFAVISTDGRAPASKERIDRLVESLNSFVDANVAVLVAKLLELSLWRRTPMGEWWLSSFIPDPQVAFPFRRKWGAELSLLETYRRMRSLALRFELEAAEAFVGEQTIATIRSSQYESKVFAPLVDLIRNAELQFVEAIGKMPEEDAAKDPHLIWHLLRPVLRTFRFYPQIYARWSEEMGHRFPSADFKNDVKGGFFF